MDGREVVVIALVMTAVAVVIPERRFVRVHTTTPVSDATAVERLGRWIGRWMRMGPQARRSRAHARMQVIRSLAALAAELEAGQAPSTALHRCAGEPPVWPHALAAVALDGDVVDALRRDAVEQPVLRSLAACWQVASDSGTGLSASVTRLAASARAAEDVRVELEGQLAAPRATARLLAGLPAVGVGLGMMLGAEPLAWLLGTTPGRLCIVAGGVLTGVGLWWTGRIAASVERLL